MLASKYFLGRDYISLTPGNSSYFIAIMGRRTLCMLGLSILDFLLLIIGIWALLGDGGKELPWAKWAQAVTQMIFYGCYTAFIGKSMS